MLRYRRFCEIRKFQILGPFIDITALWNLEFWLFILNPKKYQNEIWENISVSYDNHFRPEDGKLVPDLFIILIK